MNKPWLCSLALLALALPAAAGVGIWTPLGPDGGQVWALAVDQADPDIVYAGTFFGVFKSTDGGETWSASSRGLGPKGVFVRAILVRPEAVYIGTQDNGVFKSTDQGATWFPASNGIPPVLPGLGPNVGSLLSDPRNPNKIWAGARRGLFSTTNGGATWTTRYVGPPFDNPVLGIAIDPADGRIYISSSSRGVYTSTNQGKKWTKVSTNLRGSSYFDLVLDPENSAILHVVTGTGLWRSDNRGGSWKRVPALGDRGVTAVVYQGNRLIASSAIQGIFYSDDQGKTWTRAREQPAAPLILELAASPVDVYAGAIGDRLPRGVYRSPDRGATWEASSRGLVSQPVQAVAVDPSDPDVLYAGVDVLDVFKSTDRGATWEPLELNDPLIPSTRITALLVDPFDSSIVYAGSAYGPGGLARSLDAGATWERTTDIRFLAEALVADPRITHGVWAAGFPGLYHTLDAGATWQRLFVPGGDNVWLRDFQVDSQNPLVLWAAGGVFEQRPSGFSKLRLRLFRSIDAGNTWHRRDTGLGGASVLSVAVDPTNSSLLLAGTETGLYRSTDAGLTWTQVPGFTAEVNEVVAAPTTPTTFYANLAGFGIQRSTNGGVTWTPARRGVAPIPVIELLVDPTDPHRLYAGTETRGLFTYEEQP